MTVNCYDNTYVIYYTDSRKGTLSIPRKSLITDQLDIALVGKNRLEYGEIFDENMLHLLENFAAPALSTNINMPDTTKTYGAILSKPIMGQTWYNSTNKRIYLYNGTLWRPLGTNNDVAGNSGMLSHGAAIPRPISGVTGYQFTYAECSWNVSPFSFSGEISYMECSTDANGVVNMRYRLKGDSTLRTGTVNYQIIGIKDNINQGSVTPIPPSGSQGTTPTPTPTPTLTPSRSVTPSITPSRTRTPPVTPTHTPTPSSTPGIENFYSTSFDDNTNTGNIRYGWVSPYNWGTEILLNINEKIIGNVAVAGPILLTPTATGIRYYNRYQTDFTYRGTISPDSGFVFQDVIHAYTSGESYIIATLQVNSTASPAIARIKLYLITKDDSPSLVSSNSITFNGYNNGVTNDTLCGLCMHNNYVMLVTPPNRIYSFYFNGLTFNQISSFTLPSGHNNYLYSDGNYVYVGSDYDDITAKPPRVILTFSGSTFTQVLSQNNSGEPDLAAANGYLFTGYNNESQIQARLWNGLVLGSAITTIPSQKAAYRPLFKYSKVTNRLYNPVDNSTPLSKVYTWNGGAFNTLVDFLLEGTSGRELTSFNLGYIGDATDQVIGGPGGGTTTDS